MKKILDYEEMLELLDNLNKDIIIKQSPIGFTDFDTPIPHYTYGHGEKHIIVTAGTHSSELITNIFVLTLMKKLSDGEINIDSNKYTIHFIPIYNPDGTIICTSAIRKLLNRDTANTELMEQCLCLQYYLNSRTDDNYAINYEDKGNKLVNEMFKYVTPDDISDKYPKLRKSVSKIIKKSNLPKGIMINWSSNGNGVDLNANINRGTYFEEFKNSEERYAKLRLNQINKFKVGPTGCPSRTKKFVEEAENKVFIEFINKLKEENHIIGCIIYHSSGGIVYYLDFMKEQNYWVDNFGIREVLYNRNVASEYSKKTDYLCEKPTTYTTFCSRIRSLIPGSLVVELSKLRSNPLSQFIDIDISNLHTDPLKGELGNITANYTNTINNNIDAFIGTLETMSKEYDKYRYGMLVNRNNKCPDNLNFNIISAFSKYNYDCAIEETTLNAFKALKSFMSKNSFDIEIESGYRSFESQQEIYDEYVKEKGIEYVKKYVAKPGYSEHQTGLAIDVCLKKENRYLTDHNLPSKFISFLEKYAWEFGFIIRYPLGKKDITGYEYEPWHLRYVGLELSKQINEANITLEEYYEDLSLETN